MISIIWFLISYFFFMFLFFSDLFSNYWFFYPIFFNYSISLLFSIFGFVISSTLISGNTYAHILQQSGYKPCCSPEKMSSLKMLYMDEEQNVFQGVLPKMVVERCKCGWKNYPPKKSNHVHIFFINFNFYWCVISQIKNNNNQMILKIVFQHYLVAVYIIFPYFLSNYIEKKILK